MEEILASIRRILNEDDAPKPQGTHAAEAHAEPTIPPAHLQPPAAVAAALPPQDDVLVLDESMMVQDANPADPAAVHPVPADEPPGTAMPHLAADPLPSPPPLVGATAAGAAASSVGALLRTLANERATAVHRGGPTIEELVREEMRPLLASWLDTHLPPLVERLVRAEIERVVNRTDL